MRVFVILYNIISKVLNHTIPSGVHLGLIGQGVVVTVGVVVISIETIGVVVSDSDVDSTFVVRSSVVNDELSSVVNSIDEVSV